MLYPVTFFIARVGDKVWEIIKIEWNDISLVLFQFWSSTTDLGYKADRNVIIKDENLLKKISHHFQSGMKFLLMYGKPLSLLVESPILESLKLVSLFQWQICHAWSADTMESETIKLVWFFHILMILTQLWTLDSMTQPCLCLHRSWHFVSSSLFAPSTSLNTLCFIMLWVISPLPLPCSNKLCATIPSFSSLSTLRPLPQPLWPQPSRGTWVSDAPKATDLGGSSIKL